MSARVWDFSVYRVATASLSPSARRKMVETSVCWGILEPAVQDAEHLLWSLAHTLWGICFSNMPSPFLIKGLPICLFCLPGTLFSQIFENWLHNHPFGVNEMSLSQEKPPWSPDKIIIILEPGVSFLPFSWLTLVVTRWLPQLQASYSHTTIFKVQKKEKGFSLNVSLFIREENLSASGSFSR